MHSYDPELTCQKCRIAYPDVTTEVTRKNEGISHFSPANDLCWTMQFHLKLQSETKPWCVAFIVTVAPSLPMAVATA
jgi:hypothetical protein